MSKSMIILLAMIFNLSIQAKLYLNVSVLVKKGINIGITLASEVHSVEEVRPNVPINIKLKNGVSIDLEANFEGINTDIGPSENIIITGVIKNERAEVIKDFRNEKVLIPLMQQRLITQEKDNQLVELRILPEIK